MSEYRQGFHSRVERVQLEYDSIRARQRRVPTNSILQNLGYPLSFVVAFLMGASAMIMARWVQYHMIGLPLNEDEVTRQLVIDLGLAALIAGLVHLVIQFDSRQHMMFSLTGLWITMLGMHNLVHVYPEIFEWAFSPAWVGHVLLNTDQGTLIFRGAVFAL